MRQYDAHLEKTRKSLLAVARLQAGRGSRASLQASSQTPDSSPASVASRRDTDGVVGCRDMQAASKHGFWDKNNKRLGRDSTILSSGLHQIWRLFTKLYSAVCVSCQAARTGDGAQRLGKGDDSTTEPQLQQVKRDVR